MTSKLREFYINAIEELTQEGISDPVSMLTPLIQNIKHSQYQKLLGHIISHTSCTMNYFNESEGYTDGCLIINFSFNREKSKRYYIEFTSKIVGDYGTEFDRPSVNVIIMHDVGSVEWTGTKKEFENFTKQYTEAFNKKKEIEQLKVEISEKQRLLAKLTKVS